MKTGMLLLAFLLAMPVETQAQRGFWIQMGQARTFSPLDLVQGLLFNNQNTSLAFMGLGLKQQLARLDSLPRTGKTVADMATFATGLGELERAVLLYEESTRLDPKQHYIVGWTYLFTLHDYPRALHHLNAYDALTPDFDDSNGLYPVSYLKAFCLRGMGNHAEAVREFSKGIDSLARKHGSEWVNYKQYVSRAISYLAIGQADKALADLDSADKNATSESPLVLYYRAKAYEQQGRPTDAKRELQDALFFWQANRVKGITQPEDTNNRITEQDIEDALKP